jgi:hypothetical protein
MIQAALKEVMDKNLRLALIDEVYAKRQPGQTLYGLKDEYEIYCDTVYGDEHGATAFEELGIEPEHVEQVESFVLSLPVSENDLRSIESLTLDGDREVYACAYPYWWEMGDHFRIRSLDGIECCTNLKKLHLGQGLISDASLQPLTRLSLLGDIALDVLGNFKDIRSLLTLPVLQTTWITNVPSDDASSDWHEVLSALKEKGVVFR